MYLEEMCLKLVFPEHILVNMDIDEFVGRAVVSMP